MRNLKQSAALFNMSMQQILQFPPTPLHTYQTKSTTMFYYYPGHEGYPSFCTSRGVILRNLQLLKLGGPPEQLLHHTKEIVQTSILILLSLVVELLVFAMPLKLQNMDL